MSSRMETERPTPSLSPQGQGARHLQVVSCPETGRSPLLLARNYSWMADFACHPGGLL